MKRLKVFKNRLIEALREAFEEEHTEREIAFSFAFGILITSLPTLGLGLLLFAALDYYVESFCRLAIIASIIVMNPFSKALFYLGSINVGSLILKGKNSFSTGRGINNPSSSRKYISCGDFLNNLLLYCTKSSKGL